VNQTRCISNNLVIRADEPRHALMYRLITLIGRRQSVSHAWHTCMNLNVARHVYRVPKSYLHVGTRFCECVIFRYTLSHRVRLLQRFLWEEDQSLNETVLISPSRMSSSNRAAMIAVSSTTNPSSGFENGPSRVLNRWTMRTIPPPSGG
jgi:hypothetical protein